MTYELLDAVVLTIIIVLFAGGVICFCAGMFVQKLLQGAPLILGFSGIGLAFIWLVIKALIFLWSEV